MKNRARGALYGLAIGDALGMPTQMLSRAQIVARWGALLNGFEPAPPGHPIAAGLPAGAITDDTEQAVLLARLLVKGRGAVDPRELAEALVSWERDMAARGSLELLGPSTKRAVAAILAGVGHG
jgi:ADP-ribosylglycohydrolase